MTTLGSRLKALRIKSGMTLRQAGKKANVSFGRISDIETGVAGNIELNTLLRLCSIYGTTVAELTKGLK